ncbi:hypothetical protein RKD56_000386 [Priestia megaterium]
MDELEKITNNDSCCSINNERRSHHSPEVKKNLTSRLNRIEGQIRGIKGLIEERYLL